MKDLSWDLLKHFARECTTFNMQAIAGAFPAHSRATLARTLAYMVERGMLLKLSRENYHIIPLRADPETYSPDPFVVAKSLVGENDYYIAYGSALYIHQLLPPADDVAAGISPSDDLAVDISTEAVPEDHIIYLSTKRRMRPAIRSLNGVKYHFACYETKNHVDRESVWINHREEVVVSSVVQTLVDCLTRPQFCGGIAAVAYAVNASIRDITSEEIFFYLSANRNKSACKRFLYLSDLLGLRWTEVHEKLQCGLGNGMSLLDPSQAEKGARHGPLGLRVNVDPDFILHQARRLK